MLSKSEKELVSSELIHRLEPLSLRARLVVEGFITGLHKSPYHGFSVEFAEHRMYQPGDPLKHVDWKVYGRTDRFYIKQYQEETNLRANILLDTSNSMNFSHNNRPTKAEYGQSLAAALIYLLLEQRDAVGLGLFNKSLYEYRPSRSAITWRKELWKVLENIKIDGETVIGDVLHVMAERLNRRGLVILISDLMDDPEKIISGLHHFRHNGHEVLVFQVLDPVELDFDFKREARFEDLENKSNMVVNPWQIKNDYKREMNNFIEEIRSGCAQHNVSHYLLSTETPLEDALIALLSSRNM